MARASSTQVRARARVATRSQRFGRRAASGFSTKTCLPASSARSGERVMGADGRRDHDRLDRSDRRARRRSPSSRRAPDSAVPASLERASVRVAHGDELGLRQLAAGFGGGSAPSSRARRPRREPARERGSAAVASVAVHQTRALADERSAAASAAAARDRARATSRARRRRRGRVPRRRRSRPALDLPQAGDALRHEEPLEVVRLEELGLVGEARPRADERHVAAQHVDQLRQLVEARPPQPARRTASPSRTGSSLYRPFAVGLAERVHRVADVVAVRGSSVPTCIVRNLSICERAPIRGRAVPAGRTPGRASCASTSQAMKAKSGDVSDEQQRGDRDVDRALEPARRARDPHGRQARAAAGLRSRGCPRSDRRPRTAAARCRSARRRSRSARTSASVPSFDSPEKATITRSTSSCETSLGRSSGVPRIVRFSRSGAARLRVGVDEADEVDAVLRVLQDLARDQLADVAGADDDRILLVRDAAADDATRDRAVRRHDEPGDRPEDDDRAEVDRRAESCRERDQEEGADRADVEHADQVADGRVVRLLLIAVVQPVELREHQNQRRDQHVPRRSLGDQRGNGDADDDADEIGQEQGAPDEPAATPGVRDAPPVSQDRGRALADRWRSGAGGAEAAQGRLPGRPESRAQDLARAHGVRAFLSHLKSLPRNRGIIKALCAVAVIPCDNASLTLSPCPF